MPEETETPHPDYVKGFNEGYLLAQHLPKLAAKLPADLQGERGRGLLQGRQQLLMDREKERLPFLRSDRLSNLDNVSNTPAKGRDGQDRER